LYVLSDCIEYEYETVIIEAFKFHRIAW